MKGSESKKIEFKIRKNYFKFKYYLYLQQWIIPHFFFHMTTTYNILRAVDLPGGKKDFVKM